MEFGKYEPFFNFFGKWLCFYMLKEYTHHISCKKLKNLSGLKAKIEWPTFMVLAILEQLKSTKDWQISSNELQSKLLPKLGLSVGMCSDF